MKVIMITESFIVEDAALEDLFMAQNQLRIFDSGYQEIKMPTPNWILDKMSAVAKEIDHQAEANLRAQLRTAKARRSALRTADEKRKDLDLEIADLEKRLG